MVNMHYQAEALSIVESTVNKLLNSIAESGKFKVKNQRPKMVISFSPNRSKSWGNAQRISLSLNKAMLAAEASKAFDFIEYKSFCNDPEIGTVKDCSWQQWIEYITAHELSHWIQFNKKIAKPETFDYRKPHGEGFIMIYRALRGYLKNSSNA